MMLEFSPSRSVYATTTYTKSAGYNQLKKHNLG